MSQVQPRKLFVHHFSNQPVGKNDECDVDSYEGSKPDTRSDHSSNGQVDLNLTDFSLPSKRPRENHRKSLPIQFFPKSPEDVSSLYKALGKSFIFSKFRYPDLLEIIYSMTSVKFEAGSGIAHKDFETSDLFVVKSGKVKIEIGNTVWEEINAGGLIGEISLLHDVPHIVEAVAIEDSECWVLHNSVFDQLSKKTSRNSKVKIVDLLQKVFHSVQIDKIKQLLKVAQFEVFCPGEVIASKSLDCGKCFIVYEGQASNSTEDFVICCWEEGLVEDYLAKTLTKCLTLSLDSVMSVLGSEFNKTLLRAKLS
jgi:hypothetical protein